MKISYFGNDRQFKQMKSEWLMHAEQVWSTGQFLGGPQVLAFEKELATYCGRRYCVSMASCTDALTMAIRYLNLESESNMLVSNYSFIASASPIFRNGLSPKFLDINNSFYHPMSTDYEKAIDQKTKGIVAVSLFGSLSDLEKTEAICHKENLYLIEDAAQSFGSMSLGRKAGSFGFASCISFDPTKLLAGTSAGGALLTDDENLYHYAMANRLHGKSKEGVFHTTGVKSLLSTLNATILSMKLKKVDQWIERRSEIASLYYKGLNNIKGLKLPSSNSPSTHTYHKFVLQTGKRNELSKYLKSRGIETRVHYPKAITDEPIFRKFDLKCTNINQIKDKVLSIPLYQELLDEEIDYIIKQIQNFFNQNT